MVQEAAARFRLLGWMSRKLRYLPEERLVEVTVRTVHGGYLLRPSDKVRDRVVGILARAQARTGMRVCAFVYMSNHAHLLLRPENVQQLADFMAYANSNVAREVGRLHDWKEKFWGRRHAAIDVSEEPAAEEGRLRYLLEQGVKERLVASPRHWPGATSTHALLAGETMSGEWIDRSEQYRAFRRGEPRAAGLFSSQHTLELTPLPCWDHLEKDEIRERVRGMVKQIELEHEATGKPVLGRRAILAQHPHDRPESFERSPAPRFHAIEPAVRQALEEGYRWFVLEYRAASADFRKGLDVVFPLGCFRPPSYQPAPVPPS